MESMPLSMMKHMEEDVPPVFMILDTFDKDIKVSFPLQFISFKCMFILFLLDINVAMHAFLMNLDLLRFTAKYLSNACK